MVSRSDDGAMIFWQLYNTYAIYYTFSSISIIIIFLIILVLLYNFLFTMVLL